MKSFCELLRSVYGIEFRQASPTVCCWVLDLIIKYTSVEYAEVVRKEVNDHRNSLGMIPVYAYRVGDHYTM